MAGLENTMNHSIGYYTQMKILTLIGFRCTGICFEEKNYCIENCVYFS